MWCSVQYPKSALLCNIFCGLLRKHVGLILIFQADLVLGYTSICAP
jgi:hypothetical protein